MGKVLLIKGANFSQNAIEQIPLTDFIPTRLTNSFYVYYMDYSGTSAIRQLKTTSSAGASLKLFVADVTNYVGRTINITAATASLEGAHYCCFASDLGGFAFDQIPSIKPMPSSQSGGMINTPVTTISIFDASTTDGIKTTITKTIPSGAKYLLMTIQYAQGFTDNELNVELV